MADTDITRRLAEIAGKPEGFYRGRTIGGLRAWLHCNNHVPEAEITLSRDDVTALVDCILRAKGASFTHGRELERENHNKLPFLKRLLRKEVN
jgi:hypothetical protein